MLPRYRQVVGLEKQPFDVVSAIESELDLQRPNPRQLPGKTENAGAGIVHVR